MNTTESKQKAVTYAKNYPLIKEDGFYGPISVGNIGNFNDRVIINLCIKTLKSQPNNATISFPKDWKKASEFASGDQVNVLIEGGFVKKIHAAKAKSVTAKQSSVSAAAVNDSAEATLEAKAAGDAVEEALAEVEAKLGETAPQGEEAF